MLSSSGLCALAAIRSARVFFFTVVLLEPLIAAELSLFDAVELAERDSPKLLARLASIESAEASIGPAGQLPDPELVLGVENLPIDGDDRFSLTRDFMTMRKLGVMQSFPGREKRELRSELAASAALRERALLLSEGLGVKEAVARAWIAVSTAERRVELLESLRVTARAQIDATSAALAAGRATAADGVAAQSARIALEERIEAARADLEIARADLTQWLPEGGTQALSVPPDWLDLGIDPDSLIGKIEHHRELLVFQADARSAAAELALARAQKRPDWSLELIYAQRGPAFSNMLSLQFRVGLPVFARARQAPSIRSKQASLERVEAEREAARRMYVTELRKSLIAWRSAAKRMRLYEQDLLPLADDRAAVALAAYQSGTGDLAATLATLDAAIETRLAYSDLLGTLAQAWASLHFAFPEGS